MERKIYLAILVFFSFFLMVSLRAHAESHPSFFVITPNCLLENTVNYQILSTHADSRASKTFSFIRINSEGIAQLAEKKKPSAKICGGFADVSEDWEKFSRHHGSSVNSSNRFLSEYLNQSKSLGVEKRFPEPQHQKEVQELFSQMNPQMMWDSLAVLSNYRDRFANSESGVQIASEIKSKIEAMATENGRDDVTVYLVSTGRNYKQPSVVAKVGRSNDAGIVIGGHMDTLNSTYSKKPGADDDGTGTVTVLEAARTIIASKMQFKKPLYFIWYAAEEQGLVGSNHVVADFRTKNIPVDAVLQLDMTGYVYQNDPSIWMITDYVSKDLTDFVEKIINTYVNQPVKHTRCGYACSDHASWTQGGFASSMPAEAAFEHSNPSIHTSGDTMDKISLDHMKDYLKIAIAFGVELAEPING